MNFCMNSGLLSEKSTGSYLKNRPANIPTLRRIPKIAQNLPRPNFDHLPASSKRMQRSCGTVNNILALLEAFDLCAPRMRNLKVKIIRERIYIILIPEQRTPWDLDYPRQMTSESLISHTSELQMSNYSNKGTLRLDFEAKISAILVKKSDFYSICSCSNPKNWFFWWSMHCL